MASKPSASDSADTPDRSNEPDRLDMARELSRRKPLQHWYRPGTDTPLGYFVGHFVFVAAVVVGVPGAVIGEGWHATANEILTAALDAAWLVRTLFLKRKRKRKRRLVPRMAGRRARGEMLWIDTPEARSGIPLD